jgi:hypothetical protein
MWLLRPKDLDTCDIAKDGTAFQDGGEQTDTAGVKPFMKPILRGEAPF